MPSGKPPVKGDLASARNIQVESIQSRDGEGPRQVMGAYYKNQRTGNQTDVRLILDGGFIPAHAAILSGSSPFFQSIFQTQGFTVSPMREIYMPEFSLQIMRKVIHLLYNEQVFLKSRKEAKKVRELLNYLDINLPSELNDTEPAKSSANTVIEQVKILPKSVKLELVRQPVALSSADLSSKLGKVSYSLKSLKSSTKPPVLSKKCNTSQREESTGSESESVASSDSDTSDSEPEPITGNKKKEKVKIETVKDARKALTIKPVSDSVENNESSPETNAATRKGKNQFAIVPSKPSISLEDSDTSTDYEADESRFKDEQLFLSAAKRCQKCKTDYESPALAHGCLSRHGCLRCYFCFRLVKTTAALFSHFERAHRKGRGGREKWLLCVLCDKAIPFVSVTCHVICLHLTKPEYVVPQQNVNVRPCESIPVNVSPAKRPKLAEPDKVLQQNDLRVGDLDCTIRLVKANGKAWTFNLRRTRS